MPNVQKILLKGEVGNEKNNLVQLLKNVNGSRYRCFL